MRTMQWLLAKNRQLSYPNLITVIQWIKMEHSGIFLYIHKHNIVKLQQTDYSAYWYNIHTIQNMETELSVNVSLLGVDRLIRAIKFSDISWMCRATYAVNRSIRNLRPTCLIQLSNVMAYRYLLHVAACRIEKFPLNNQGQIRKIKNSAGLSLLRYNHFMGVNKMRVKKYYCHCVG